MNILVTGVAGAGKTTIARELQKRGYTAYDTDTVVGLSEWIERATGKSNPNYKRTAAKDWVDLYDWLWDEKALRRLLAKSGIKPVYFCGSSANQDQFYELFDKIFLLEVDSQLLRQRLLSSNREHDFGSRPGELEVILRWFEGFQDKTKTTGAIVIDARKSTGEIVEEIVET